MRANVVIHTDDETYSGLDPDERQRLSLAVLEVLKAKLGEEASRTKITWAQPFERRSALNACCYEISVTYPLRKSRGTLQKVCAEILFAFVGSPNVKGPIVATISALSMYEEDSTIAS